MLIANYLETKNDRNGNPRRGWLITDTRVATEYFVEEGYDGRGAFIQWQIEAVRAGILTWGEDIPEIRRIPVMPKEYNKFKQLGSGIPEEEKVG